MPAIWPQPQDLGFFIRRIVETRRSGVLRKIREPVRRFLYFEDGWLVFAHSNVKREKLGQILIEEGILHSEKELQDFLAAKKKKRLGAFLMEQGVIAPDELQRMVEKQIRSIFFRVFYDPTPFEWEERRETVYRDLKVPIRVSILLEEAILNDPDPARYTRLIPPDDWWVLAHEESVMPREFFSSEDQLLRSQLVHPKSIRDLRCEITLDPVVFAQRLYLGLVFGYFIARPPEFMRRVATSLYSATNPYLNPLPPDWETFADRVDAMDPWEVFALRPDAPPELIEQRYEQLNDWLQPILYDPDLSPERRQRLQHLIERVAWAYAALRQQVRKAQPAPGEPSPPAAPATVPPSRPAASKRELFRYIEDCITTGELDEARRVLREHRDVLATEPDFYYLMALILAQQPTTRKQAEVYLRKAIEKRPEQYDYWIALAILYKDLGARDRAIDILQQVLERDPKNFRARQLLELYKSPDTGASP